MGVALVYSLFRLPALTPDPASQADGGQPYGAPPQKARRLGAERVGDDEATVGCGLGHWCRPWVCPAFGRRHPPGDVREAFRGADRALLRIVQLGTVKTQAGSFQLHETSPGTGTLGNDELADKHLNRFFALVAGLTPNRHDSAVGTGSRWDEGNHLAVDL